MNCFQIMLSKSTGAAKLWCAAHRAAASAPDITAASRSHLIGGRGLGAYIVPISAQLELTSHFRSQLKLTSYPI
jgi:hypothetical protein